MIAGKEFKELPSTYKPTTLKLEHETLLAICFKTFIEQVWPLNGWGCMADDPSPIHTYPSSFKETNELTASFCAFSWAGLNEIGFTMHDDAWQMIILLHPCRSAEQFEAWKRLTTLSGLFSLIYIYSTPVAWLIIFWKNLFVHFDKWRKCIILMIYIKKVYSKFLCERISMNLHT